MKNLGKVILCLTALLFVCLISRQAAAQSFLLSKVVDRNTAIPGGSGNFASFLSGNPVISGKSVAFLSGDGSHQEGYYVYNGTSLSKIADLNTAIPNGSGNFHGLNSSNPVISGNNVAFEAWGLSQQGYYVYNGTSLTTAVDFNTPIPGGSGNFYGFPNISGQFISNNNLAFEGDGSSGYGIYLSKGTILNKVADYNTPIPSGTGNFTTFTNYLWISGDNVVFAGGTDHDTIQYGIYLYNGSTLNKVVDAKTPIPGGTGNFTHFDREMISATNVVFPGSGANGQEGTGGRVCLDRQKRIISGTLPVHAATCFCGSVFQ